VLHHFHGSWKPRGPDGSIGALHAAVVQGVQDMRKVEASMKDWADPVAGKIVGQLGKLSQASGKPGEKVSDEVAVRRWGVFVQITVLFVIPLLAISTCAGCLIIRTITA